MSLFNKHHTPADQGFEAVRHETFKKKKRKVIPPVVPPVVPPTEQPKDIYKEQFAQLAQSIADMQKTLQQLVESDKKVHEETIPTKPDKVRQQVVYDYIDRFDQTQAPFSDIKDGIEHAVEIGELNQKEADLILTQLR